MSDIKTKDLFDYQGNLLTDLFKKEYPWEILPLIKDKINSLLKTGIKGYTLLEEGILVGENVKIAKTATIIPPCIIGHNVEIRPGAYLRGEVIVGDNCVLGNSSEFKHCILLDNVQAPHFNYVGDSILGNHSHLGAGVICSNLRADKQNIVIKEDKEYVTGLRKIGAFIGDNAEIGCNAVLNPGTIIGKYSQIYPTASIRGVVPSYSIVKVLKTNLEIIKKSHQK